MQILPPRTSSRRNSQAWLFRRIFFGLLLLLAVTGLGGWLWFTSQAPDLNATHRLPGLTATAEVLYDEYGVPHIYAQNEEDLFYSFGFVHAQDRLFQMELLRRLADGRLAEVFGPAALPSDRFFRTLGFRQVARHGLDSVYRANPQAPHVRAANAYLRGVNAFIARGKTPMEFLLTGIPKTPFTLEDVGIIEGYMAFNFAEAFGTDANLTYIAERWGPAYVADMTGDYPTNAPRIPTTVPKKNPDKVAVAVADTLRRLADRFMQIGRQAPFPPFYGSNGWLLAGSRTKSGKPMLVNDTHVQYSQPTVYYEAHLDCPGLRFYGSFIAGLPFAVLGHNAHGGWGITMFENDDLDFYREKPNPANPNQVWYRDHWETLTTRTERIRVKNGPDVLLPVQTSRHGPLLQRVDSSLNADMRPGKPGMPPVALWWTFYQFTSRNLEATYGLAHARNATEAARLGPLVHAPGLNVMWADTAGNIAWWAVAKLVHRPPHVRPWLLLDGSTGADDPLGWYDFAQNPQSLNPRSGLIYSANNQPDDTGIGLVPGYYVPGDRAARINQLLLTDKRDWTPAQMRPVVNDVVNPQYAADLAVVLPLIDRAGFSATEQRAYTLLRQWTGSHNLTDVAPTVFYRFYYRLFRLAMADELGDRADGFLNSLPYKRNLHRWLRHDASPWWDNVTTPKRETRAEILTLALRRTVADLTRQLGSNPADWQWQRVHTLTHHHPLGAGGPLLARLFDVGPMPIAGGRETLNYQGFVIDSTGRYNVGAGPNLRRIVDFADPDHATSILPTGQSGNRASPHYADQAGLFARGQARPERMNRQEIERVQTGRMRFNP